MPINNREIVKLMADLSEKQNLKTTISQSVKGGFIAGGSAMLGGVLLGPLGLAVGGLLGGLTAANTCSSFKPLAEILIHDLSPAQQAVLINRVRNIIKDVDATDFVTLSALVFAGGSLQEKLVNVLQGFVVNELRLALT